MNRNQDHRSIEARRNDMLIALSINLSFAGLVLVIAWIAADIGTALFIGLPSTVAFSIILGVIASFKKWRSMADVSFVLALIAFLTTGACFLTMGFGTIKM